MGILMPGDLILSLDENQLSNANEFYLQLAASAAIQDTTLKVLRRGTPMSLTIPSVGQ
jgi:S1-C subfamily serine protease